MEDKDEEVCECVAQVNGPEEDCPKCEGTGLTDPKAR